ncbi:MAG: hypothetical protein WBO61_04305, partial [Gemmiger qucibialis]
AGAAGGTRTALLHNAGQCAYNLHILSFTIRHAGGFVNAVRGRSRGKIFVTIPKPGREGADAGFFTCLTKKSQR